MQLLNWDTLENAKNKMHLSSTVTPAMTDVFVILSLLINPAFKADQMPGLLRPHLVHFPGVEIREDGQISTSTDH